MLLYVIRHGDPIYWPDSLTLKGVRQSEALARRFAQTGLDVVYSSPLGRAKMTAQPTCELLGLEMKIEDWMSEDAAWEQMAFEVSPGAFMWPFQYKTDTYKTEENLALGDKWYTVWPFNQSKCKEGYERISRESDRFLAELGYEREGLRYRITKPNDLRVAAFCHQGFGTTWLSHLLGIPPLLFWSTFDLNHSSVTIIRFENCSDGYCAPMCIALSDTSHLYADRLPLVFNNEFGY